MREVVENLQRLLHDGVRAFARDIHYEPGAACIVFVRRIVQSLRPWNTVVVMHGSMSASNP